MFVNADANADPNPAQEIAKLRKQVRQLQVGAFALLSFAIAAATTGQSMTLRAKSLVLVDDLGRERIVLSGGERVKQGRPGIEFRDQNGAQRLFVGDEPDSVIGGRVYPRVAPAWGLLLFNPDGNERGGMAYLDNGRSVISLDRPNAEGVYMTVNEKSGFAGLVGNYASEKPGQYNEAFRLGTLGPKVFAQATNQNGSRAGAIVGGAGGPVKRTLVVQR